MTRSIMVKGSGTLTLECFLAGQKAVIQNYILASLYRSYPSFGWYRLTPHIPECSAIHQTRWAAEVTEVAKTLRDLDLKSQMAAAAALTNSRKE